ncbi:MAG: sigma 54-interacting transcriptional regulator [Desulfotalea sp.]
MRAEERIFFKQIRKAITTNPFSEDRITLDLEATGMSLLNSNDEILGALVHRVEQAIKNILSRISSPKQTLTAEDYGLLQSAMLFRVFHIFCNDYDQLIQEQIEIGASSCKVKFAEQYFTILTEYGFKTEDSTRFFALFFQMRRAFYFIRRIRGQSQCVKDLRKSLWHNVFTCDIELYDKYLWSRLEDFSTMLLGKTGTGKGLAASSIGRSGFIPFDKKNNCFAESFSSAFVSINLSQFPEQLIESELFGHKRGAFTGAVDSHHGIFSRCSASGAIFLDEIGDVAIPVQIKLLQVLQERSFTSVGDRNIQRFQGRVIAATNKSLDKMRQEGEFRDDFYYRLCSDVIKVPSLKQRLSESPDEINVLLDIIVRRILGVHSEEVVAKVAGYIQNNQPANYKWPGNIRELEQCVRRILISNSYDWQLPQGDSKEKGLAESIKAGAFTAQELLAKYCNQLYQQNKTYESVAQKTQLDRRTVKKYIEQANSK